MCICHGAYVMCICHAVFFFTDEGKKTVSAHLQELCLSLLWKMDVILKSISKNLPNIYVFTVITSRPTCPGWRQSSFFHWGLRGDPLPIRCNSQIALSVLALGQKARDEIIHSERWVQWELESVEPRFAVLVRFVLHRLLDLMPFPDHWNCPWTDDEEENHTSEDRYGSSICFFCGPASKYNRIGRQNIHVQT